MSATKEIVKTTTQIRMEYIQGKLASWTDFVHDLRVPSDIHPAIASGRIELMKLARARDMKADEVQVLYDLIGGLLETNAVLREHAALVAELSANQQGHVSAALRSLQQLRDFANFEYHADDDEDE